MTEVAIASCLVASGPFRFCIESAGEKKSQDGLVWADRFPSLPPFAHRRPRRSSTARNSEQHSQRCRPPQHRLGSSTLHRWTLRSMYFRTDHNRALVDEGQEMMCWAPVSSTPLSPLSTLPIRTGTQQHSSKRSVADPPGYVGSKDIASRGQVNTLSSQPQCKEECTRTNANQMRSSQRH